MKVCIQEDEEGTLKVEVSGTMETGPQEQLAPPAEASEPKRSEFAAVVFDQTAETYPVDANVECCYTLTTDIQPSSKDWVGLFRVGWLSPRDYLYYQWAPVPEDYEAGKDAQAKIVFPADCLPKDDGEFYQFCYVSSASCIRGASTPFQFKRPSADDFVELDDSDSEMLVIRPKTAFLEEEVTKYKKLVQSMETEREGLVEKLRRARSKAESCAHEANQLHGKLEDMTHAMRDMSMAHDEVKSRLEMFEKERERLDDQVLQEEEHVKQCLQTIKALEDERDELAGSNSSLTTEVGSYRNTIVDLETQLRNVATRLQQTEDQLQAVQQMKRIMEEELEAYKLSQDKLSRDLETTSGQNHALKEQLQLMEVGFADELKLMKAEERKKEEEFEALRKKLELSQQENFVLMKQLDDVERNSLVSQEAAASLFALQKANDALKARHDKMSAALEEKEKEITTFARQTRQKERELRREAEDYRQRVEMCKTEYKTLITENSRLRQRLSKYRKRNNDDVMEKSTETIAAVTKTVACQQAVTTVNCANDANTSSMSDAATDTGATSSSTSSAKMEALASELEARKHKKDKYKRLYLEEKERGDMLRSHYYEELQKKQTELERLRKQAVEAKDNLKQQILTLQNCIEQKDQIIQDLYTNLREVKMEEKSSGFSSPQPLHTPSPKISDITEPQLIHGNPYEQEGAAVYYRPTTEEEAETSSEQSYNFDAEEGAYAGPDVHSYQMVMHDEVDAVRPPNQQSSFGTGQLPPPLQPEVLPEARLAAVRQQLGFAPSGENEDQLFEDCAGYAGAMPSAPAAPEHQEDERFMDAIGEGMKICPVCETHIATMSDAEFAEHVISHFGRLCPVCKLQADDTMESKEFEAHVNKCCENARSSRVQ